MTSHRGESVAPGVAVGPVCLRGWEDDGSSGQRIPADRVEHELNLLREALQRSRNQIEEIRQKQQGNLAESELRIFDAHIAYLSDPMFVTEIENQVLQERFPVREAIKFVFDKYDRIFQLVESEILRRRASDLRDVSTRLLRNLGDAAAASGSGAPSADAAATRVPTGSYILVAKKLTTADMFNLDNEHVEGIVAEEGGMSSHAAILARSMGIPTLTGIRDLPRLLRTGDVVVLDASHGTLETAPGEHLLGEATAAAQRWKATRQEAPEGQLRHQTRDGTPVQLLGSCGSLGEADLVRTFGMAGIGLFRTELSFLVDKDPTEDQLAQQYRQLIEGQHGRPIGFRLLDVAAATLAQTPGAAERNPAMGQRGVRGLLLHQPLLRRQLRALLRAAAGTQDVGVLVPFVTGVADLQRIKSALVEERVALIKAGTPCAERLLLAPVVEVPAAALALASLLNECDFALVAVDDLQALLLAADRDNAAVRNYHEMAHPAVFEVLARMAKDAERRDKPIVLFGESAADPVRVPFYIGAGYRSFSVAPVRLRGMLRVLQRYTVEECRKIAARILEAPRTLDVQKVLVGLDVDATGGAAGFDGAAAAGGMR